MTTTSFHIGNLLEKMLSSDKDFRFMATNDLMTELQKDSIKLDEESERKVVKMLLKLLEDKNGEVQNLAVKCLGPLVTKIKEVQVESMVDTLCINMLNSEKEQLRDISSIGLKTVISELPNSATGLAASVCKKIAGRLISAISKEDVAVQLEALDILADLLSRYGALLVTFHPSIQQALLPQLASQRLAIRKRSITALSHLVLSSSKVLFSELMDYLRCELSRNSSISTTRTYIQCLAAVTRQAGHRVGEYLEVLLPLVLEFAKTDDDEVREHCLHCFEAFVRRCPQQISNYMSKIISTCLTLLSYDPNYNYEEDEDMEGMEVDDDDDTSEDEYSDDDDMSWKVRRAAAKCLEASIASRLELLEEYCHNVAPVLVSRFKEREENVKADIFQAYTVLLQQTRASVPTDQQIMDPEDPGALVTLQLQIPELMKAVQKQILSRSTKTRHSCILLLKQLVQVMPGYLSDHMTSLVRGIVFSLSDKNSTSSIKIEMLCFVNLLLLSHPPVVFHRHLPELLPPCIACVSDPFYKITSEALLVLQQFIKVIRPLEGVAAEDYKVYIPNIYKCTLRRLQASDIDQEVKERAISCMGHFLCHLGDCSSESLSQCLPIFLERLHNEITRLTAVRALSLIASSPLHLDLSAILPDALPPLASFLRKSHRALRLTTLSCLDTLVFNYGVNYMNDNMLSDILKELFPLVNESDLHISQLALDLLSTIISVNQNCISRIQRDCLEQVDILLCSPLLHRAALQAIVKFYVSLSATGARGCSTSELIQRLLALVHKSASSGGSQLHKQAYHSIAKCIAGLSLEAGSIDIVAKFSNHLQQGDTSDPMNLISLLVLGELGKTVNLAGHRGIQNVIISLFSSSNEDVKSSASYALGCISVGNLTYFLPVVLVQIEQDPKRQYLLLHSLKEIITCQKSIQLIEPHIDAIWKLLMSHSECPEEGTRNVVAECLGRLVLLDAHNLLGKLKENLRSPSALTRGTVVTAVKFTISEQPAPVDTLLRHSMRDFLAALEDVDLNVRRVALMTFNSAAHNKPSLIRDLLTSVLPLLYCETKIRKELIREVEMGPFKHTVDDGLDLRKAAFECMYTLLDSSLDRLSIFEFLSHVEEGLTDHYDIKMLTYLMLIRLSQLSPSALLQHMEQIIEPLRATCTSKVKAMSVKQEFEKLDELKRSALRAFNALLMIPDADKSPQANQFYILIKSNEELAAMFESIQKDTTSNGEPILMEIN